MRFAERAVIITGGAVGLGFALARRIIAEGGQVAIFDRDSNQLESAAAELGDCAGTYLVDVTAPWEVRQAVEGVIAKNGRVDALVNCAAIVGKTNLKSHEVPLDDWDRVMQINAKGSLIAFQAVVPHMLEREYGRVLHVASIAGKEGNAGMVSYSMSKAAVIAMAKCQGKEYAASGVTINAIAPATILTPMVASMPTEQVKYMTDKIPMKRCGTTEEFANLASWIISEEASFTTGFCFDLSGGRATY